MILFNIPPYVGTEINYISEAVKERKISGDGAFTKRCSEWLEEHIGGSKALLTTSCTHALEVAALLCGIKPGDEVIMPSYTFTSTANAFVLRGAKIVFVDIRPDTMNINENLIEHAVTEHTKAIVPVHYAGIPCEMEKITDIAERYGLFVVEDAAQAITSKYKGKNCGALGDFGCFSFHETKNLSCGEGGALIINNQKHIEQAEIIREKGTNRSKFFRGEIDKYTWVNQGSSYLPSELNAAYLLAQMEHAEQITEDRMRSWNHYSSSLSPLQERGTIKLPYIPPECEHNAHMFYIKLSNTDERARLIGYLKEKEILTVFHYIPLHSSQAGKQYGRFHGIDKYTTTESECLLRLPLYFGMLQDERESVINAILTYFIERAQ